MVNTENIIVVGDKVLIKPSENLEKTNSGLYLPPNVAEKEKVQGGYVIKTGPGYAISAPEDDEPWSQKKASGFIPLQAHEGDFALFVRKDTVEVELEGEKLLIVPHNAILLLVRDNDLLSME